MTQRSINLFLVRHALSAANLDKTVNLRMPDHAVPLARSGLGQADAAGVFLAELLNPDLGNVYDGRTRLLVSPYTRTRQTAERISNQLIRMGIRHDVREEIALREIGFGLFDGVPDEHLEREFPREYGHYLKHLARETGEHDSSLNNSVGLAAPGEFWAKMPMGESRAEVADRVKGVFGTILRDNDPDREDPVVNFVVVSHGVTLRAFAMQWLHHPYEWYATQSNPANASVQLIRSVVPEHNAGRRYSHSLIYPGFPHRRQTTQTTREEGVVL